jgi:hypothetical protein
MIIKTQGVYLVVVGDTQVIPGRKERTWNEPGNACALGIWIWNLNLALGFAL